MADSNKKNIKKARFNTVEIRHYPFVLSDNPGGRYGPPIELGWEYSSHPDGHFHRGCEVKDELNIGLYEKERRGKRRRAHSLYLSPLLREIMLREANYTHQDLQRAIRRKNNIRRRRSMSNLGLTLNPVAHIHTAIQGETRLRKLSKAKRNLQKMQGDEFFFEHADIYRGWMNPFDIDIGHLPAHDL